MENVLVTGASGFIGKNLVDRLLKEKVNVYVLLRKPIVDYKKEIGVNPKINYVFFDDIKLHNMMHLPEMDVCFNLAGYGIDYKDRDIDQMIEGNIRFLLQLIQFSKYNKTKLIVNTGSGAEYGIIEGKKISEKDIMQPQSLYGISKFCGFKMGNLYAKENGVEIVTVRPFGVYGPGEKEHRLVPQLIRSLEEEKTLEMTLGEQIRDYIYIDDLIDAYIKIAKSPNKDIYGVYNVCSSEGISVKEIANIIEEIYGLENKHSKFKFGSIPYRIDEIMYYVGDNTKILNEIGWKPSTDIRDGLKKMIEWWKIKSSYEGVVK